MACLVADRASNQDSRCCGPAPGCFRERKDAWNHILCRYHAGLLDIETQNVPRFDGTVSWHQHQQVLNAIAKSNGCYEETAALQLFAHLEGNVLNVALLMPEDKRATLTELSEAMSDYFNLPGRSIRRSLQK